jgi:hypothetical protein
VWWNFHTDLLGLETATLAIREASRVSDVKSLIFLLAETNLEDVPREAFTPGFIGGIFFFAMLIAVVLLWRNMNKRLRRLDEKFNQSNSQDE